MVPISIHSPYTPAITLILTACAVTSMSRHLYALALACLGVLGISPLNIEVVYFAVLLRRHRRSILFIYIYYFRYVNLSVLALINEI